MNPDDVQPLQIRLAILGTRGIPARYGGFETFAEKLAIGLSKLGVEVTVFCEGKSRPAHIVDGVRTRYVPAPAIGPFQTILYDMRCLWKARKDYDVVYMLGYGAAPFCLIPRVLNTEVWINPDGIEWARAKWGTVAKTYFRLMEWTCIRTAHRIVADAQAISESLASRHGRISKCTFIPYGCEIVESRPPIEFLSDWGVKEGGYFLIVCRLEPENHVLEMLRAFQRSSSKRELIVVGNHLGKSEYQEQVRAIDDPRIRLIGALYDQQKLTALRFYSFAYLHGHSVGGTNPSLLEAMGCGNLIFAHDNPFNRETLGECGIYFKETADLTDAIQSAEKEDSDLTRLREASQRRARSDYQWEDIIARYLALLTEPRKVPKN